MVNLSLEEKKLLQRLYGARLLEPLQALLQRRLDDVDKTLRVASGEMLFRSQGRAQELDSLIQAFTMNASNSA